MFRRFMIVCWVLFTISAVTGLVGWVGYEYYDTKAEGFAERQSEAHESKTPLQITNEEDANFVADMIRQGVLTGDRKEAAFQALEEFRQRQGLEPDQNVAPDSSVFRRSGDRLVAPTNPRREPFMVAGLLGGMLAGAILLWNIFCYTVHWIWMGRNVPPNQQS